MPTSVWMLAAVAIVAVVALAVLLLWWSGSRRTPAELPQEWPLMQRPIFSAEERALYRQLRTALPHHTILAKLPLVRFCQPIERNDLRYWFELLGPIHVSFVVCAENGRALAAIDIDRPRRRASERAQRIKQSVLDACRIRYVRCSAEQLPTAAELQLLVPHQGEASRPWMPVNIADSRDMRSTLAHAVRARRGDTESQWVDSGYAADSFFAPDASAETAPGTLPDATPGPAHDAGAPPRDAGRWVGAAPVGPAGRPRGFGDDAGDTHSIGRR